MTTITKYTFSDVEKIKNDNSDIELPQDIIDFINSLSEKVGAPTYSKTPVFSKGNKPRNKKRPKNMEITNEDWSAIRSFQTTELARNKEGVEKDIEDLRMLLNKITTNNFVEVNEEISNNLDKIISSSPAKDDLLKIGTSVFEIASSNKFYSSVYAELYEKFIKKDPVFEDIFQKNFTDFVEIFTSIRYVDPDEDYTEFCKVNKENEKRRALSLFFVNLMKCHIASQESIISIIKSLQKMMKDNIKTVDCKHIVEEITEVLFVIISSGSVILDEHDEWDEIYEFIKEISEIKGKSEVYPSISNKIIFKHMDMIDALHD